MRNTTRLATLTLLLGVAGIYAQPGPINMTVSGSASPSTVSLQAGTNTSEYRLAGNGALGQFDLRVVSVTIPTPQQSTTCVGPTKSYFPVPVGAGVFRFQNGDLLMGNLTGGSDCVDFSGQPALCTRIFQITGGTGRFQNSPTSGGTLTLTMSVAPVVPNRPGFFAVTGQVTGVVPGVAVEQGPQGGQP